MDKELGEIRLFAFKHPPRDWLICDGAVLPIASNQALFALIGTRYGGDGVTTFALPDLQARVPIGAGECPSGSEYPPGTQGGSAKVSLTANEMPMHVHHMQARDGQAETSLPSEFTSIAAGREDALEGRFYAPADALTPLAAGAVSTTGGGEAHDNMQPSLVMNWCIAVSGWYPRRP